MKHPYQGIVATLTTKHSKTDQIAPAFSRLGIRIEVAELDTDLLGTFSPELPRKSSQRETVLTKARLGMAKLGSKYGLASEASVGSDPFLPFLNSTLEAIAWIDEVHGIELVEIYRDLEIVVVQNEIKSKEELAPILHRADFPNHGLIIYTRAGEIIKGIRDYPTLDSSIDRLLDSSDGESIFIESDLRAHMSPSRQKAISECAFRFVERLEQLCPECDCPGYGELSMMFALPCESCGLEVHKAIRGRVIGCLRCPLRKEILSDLQVAPARLCDHCNP